MEFKLMILCEEFEYKRSVDGKIIMDKGTDEYYVVPLTKSPTIYKSDDDDVYNLVFDKQLLWLKYSNHRKEILIGDEYGFNDFIVIPSKNIIDIYIKLSTTQCFRKNVWQSRNNVRLNKKYCDKYILALPVIEDMIEVNEFGVGIVTYQVSMISNEVLLKKPIPSEHNCNFIVTNNFLLNKEALFVVVDDGSVDDFIKV